MNLKSRKALTTLIRKFWGLWKEMGNNEKMQWGVENLDPQGKILWIMIVSSELFGKF